MTERNDVMRVLLYGCSHKPKVSAMVSPKIGDEYHCPVCRRSRRVTGVHTTWAYARIACQGCKWQVSNDNKFGKKAFTAIAVRHADSRLHSVEVHHDGQVDVIKPQSFKDVPLIDDLLLP